MNLSRKRLKRTVVMTVVATILMLGYLAGASGNQSRKIPHLALVMDASGSMAKGQRWQKAIDAALGTIENPNEDVRLKVWAFESDSHVWPYGWRKLPDMKVRDQAVEWLRTVGTQGATYPTDALVAAISEKKHPLYVVMVTDGEMSSGVASICSAVAEAQAKRKNPACLSVLMIDGKKSAALKKMAEAWRGAYIESD